MKHLITLTLVLAFGMLNTQSNFNKGMDKAFELWNANKINEAENLFERIANAEKDNWLPHYYIVQINSIKSWNEKDETVLKAQLDKAQSHLDTAMSLSEDNPELLVMQGQIYTNWVAFDGRTYGMKYAAKVSELYNKAYELAPKNPRVVMCKADWAMGSARYFGQDPTPYCKELESSLELFETFEVESKYHPNWGEMRAKEALKQCKA
ncbi:MAG: hypothetical protein HKP48_01710 [Winogradskyella sp.]|uniref:tetratricopeptide repeat protein n=1 Tax=Winogradskyella sp. TaxID=1883156 RepID=UPI0018143D16|nr:hypothetical protein [Winogradskyella sp.]MBT8243774.1 hypothetical protein [Winogradskyella sp.]NNK22034.1 hypothetical protein [Winogradskyella sp.]